MGEEYLARMKHIAFRGGKIALELISSGDYHLKPDKSVLTKADVEISKLSRNVIDDLLKTSDHMLIDEENTESAEYSDDSHLENTPFIWAIDPIDGSRAFSNRMPNFGISIGLLKELKPWLGVVYFPMFGELFYSDGKQSFFVQNAFTEREETKLISPVDHQISSQSIFISNDSFFEKFDWDFSDCKLMNPLCAVLGLCWPTIGRGCGAFFGAHIWDFSGSWPIFLSAALSLRSYQTGKEITQLDITLFARGSEDPWKLREFYILSSEQNFSLLKGKIIPKNKIKVREKATTTSR
jgi:fructose-1,6-bisphosphatase/inositol monophosphatase family enzyme